jgi:hypothetical protein
LISPEREDARARGPFALCPGSSPLHVRPSPAVESANSQLDLGGFNRASLIDQPLSAYGEGLTHAEAVYAVDRGRRVAEPWI